MYYPSFMIIYNFPLTYPSRGQTTISHDGGELPAQKYK